MIGDRNKSGDTSVGVRKMKQVRVIKTLSTNFKIGDSALLVWESHRGDFRLRTLTRPIQEQDFGFLYRTCIEDDG